MKRNTTQEVVIKHRSKARFIRMEIRPIKADFDLPQK